MQFLYMGFDQKSNVRYFRFQCVLPTEPRSRAQRFLNFTLHSDMSQWARYKISIQDGPKLCLGILNTALDGSVDNAGQFASYEVTSADLAAFASIRTAIDEAKAARRKPRTHFKPAASSQLKWPQHK